MTQALLLAAHGTRSAAGAAECETLARQVRRQRPGLAVEIGNLELAEPSLDTAFDRLTGGGAREITAVPLLLFRARHAKHDIPAALDRLRRQRPQVTLRYGAPLGLEPVLLELLRARVRESLGTWDPTDTGVVVVRAGSTDPDARRDIATLAGQLAGAGPCQVVEPAFAGIAEPGIAAALERCRRQGVRRIVAVPYLLFAGHLADRVRRQGATFESRHPEVRVRTTGHVGPDPAVARLLLDRFDATAVGRDPWAPDQRATTAMQRSPSKVSVKPPA